MSRPQKIHKPLEGGFNEILCAVAIGSGKGKATALALKLRKKKTGESKPPNK
jgi:hypothetical protein